MSENTDIMRKGYDAFARGDMDTVRSIWADDIDWQGPHERLPQGGHFNGADEVIGMLAKLPEHYDELSVSPDEYLEDGDTVIAVGHISAQAKSSGEQFETPFAHVWRMKDAKVNQALLIEDSAVIARSLGV